MNDSLKQLYYETRILLRVVILNLIFRKNISSRLYPVIEGKQKNVKYNVFIRNTYVHVQAVEVFYYWKILT